MRRLRILLKKLQSSDHTTLLAKFLSGGVTTDNTTTTTITSSNSKTSPKAFTTHSVSPSSTPSVYSPLHPPLSCADGARSNALSLTSATKSNFSLFSSVKEEGCRGEKMSEVNGAACQQTNGASTSKQQQQASNGSSDSKECFKNKLSDVVQFLELVGSLKHTKRTGWVLRDVNDCESISGHMYRMSMMTFLLDGTEGLNQIRCMELALVHDLAESLVGDITPFCGVSKEDKKSMEMKAMEDICKLIQPRGKRMMELFEEYELGESAESRFVKDLDRLDMVLQAFEYEKRDDCVLKHQEFFDSTHGKFNHPFVIKLVNEIHDQRKALALAKGEQNGYQPLHEEQKPDQANDCDNNKATSS